MGLLFSVFFVSCENKMSTIQELTTHDSLPQQSLSTAEIRYTDNGNTKAILKAKVLDQYAKPKDYLEFPQGVEIFFYDSLQQLSGKIQADYAIRHNQKQLIVAKNNVHIFDYAKDRELITELLYWNQNSKQIYNYHFTTLKENQQVMHGDSLSLSEDMKDLELKQIRATIDYKDEPSK